MIFRLARPGDAAALAELHADSWRRHYRGAFTDVFLDHEAPGQLSQLWADRLQAPPPQARTILAEQDGRVVGVAHTFLNEDPTWGAFLDNLHVVYGLKRQGIGTRLLTLTRQAVRESSPSSGLYLWVLEQNTGAQAFYTAQGGVRADRAEASPPGGNPAWLAGHPQGFRYVWSPDRPPA